MIKTFKCKELNIRRKKPGVIHYDGDPMMSGEEVHIQLEEKGIRVVVNPDADKAVRKPNALQTAAAEVQEEHTFRSVREDLVRDYLDRKLPENWKDMELYERIQWLENPGNQGTVTREKVCLLEIWCEVFNGNKTSFTNTDQREMKAIMDRVGWRKAEAPRQCGKAYGKQRVYLRPGDRLMRFLNGDAGNGDQK